MVRVLAVAHPVSDCNDFQLAILCFTVTRCVLYSKTSCDCFSREASISFSSSESWLQFEGPDYNYENRI